MVTHSFYESDGRVSRYAEALAQRGDDVTVIALRGSASRPQQEIINGVRVLRVQDRFGKTERSPLSYLLPILRFGLRASLRLAAEHRRNRFDLIHVHNVPDFLVFSAWYPRMKGVPVVLDIHDILPEFFASKFSAPEGSLVVRMLRRVERTSAAFARHVIIANHLWLEKYEQRSAASGKCSVFINNVDESIFRPHPRTTRRGPLVVFPGSLNWHQGVDIAIAAFARVRTVFPDARFHIYGDGSVKGALVDLAERLGLENAVRFFDPLPIDEIAVVMADADLAVVPKRADSFGNEAYSTKIMEFMSVGVPVVVSETRIDRYYFNDDVVRFFESGNAESLANAMLEVLGDAKLRARLVEAGRAYAQANSWSSRKADYLMLVDSLASTR
jgi:glycosyltransferase involved in cell wall biosynthesis